MKKTIIIAEAGVNHNGDIKLAKKLIDIASEAGADFVKFQTFKAENLVTQNAEKAQYQKVLTKKEETHFQMIKNLELNKSQHEELMNYCSRKKISFLSAPFDIDSVNMLYELDIPFYKIPSGEITNFPLLRYVAGKKKPIVLSSGMSFLDEIQDAINILIRFGVEKKQITILHCNTEYPTPYQDVNLRAMFSIRDQLGVKVGYSDHTLGIEVPIAAVALGAVIIEKHFTVNRKLPGPDHAASLDPKKLRQMINAIRNIDLALGQKSKEPSESEKKNIVPVRKSIVAKVPIKKGALLTEKNLTTKRPALGISPMCWEKIIGTVAKKSYVKDEII